jgi:hypothetical protein
VLYSKEDFVEVIKGLDQEKIILKLSRYAYVITRVIKRWRQEDQNQRKDCRDGSRGQRQEKILYC